MKQLTVLFMFLFSFAMKAQEAETTPVIYAKVEAVVNYSDKNITVVTSTRENGKTFHIKDFPLLEKKEYDMILKFSLPQDNGRIYAEIVICDESTKQKSKDFDNAENAIGQPVSKQF